MQLFISQRYRLPKQAQIARCDLLLLRHSHLISTLAARVTLNAVQVVFLYLTFLSARPLSNIPSSSSRNSNQVHHIPASDFILAISLRLLHVNEVLVLSLALACYDNTNVFGNTRR